MHFQKEVREEMWRKGSRRKGDGGGDVGGCKHVNAVLINIFKCGVHEVVEVEYFLCFILCIMELHVDVSQIFRGISILRRGSGEVNPITLFLSGRLI